jgi:hypothetical protein
MNPRILWLIVLFLPLWSGVSLADIIKPNSLDARSDGVNITIRWTSDDETGVARFEVERQSDGDGTFATVAVLDPKGASLYEFVDRTVFRKSATLYYYRIKVVFSNNQSPVYTASIPVSHTVSSVRRTWGSIKSMFR